jgi:hypothetical protein
MTFISMLVYLKAKKDGEFLDEISSVFAVPDNDEDVLKKASFANIYAAWLIAKGRWVEFVKANEIEL